MNARDERSRGPFGPLEMLDAVQRQALEAALRVADELGPLAGDLAGDGWFGAARAGTREQPRAANPPVDVGRVRANVFHAAESFSELMRAMLDVGFDAIDELGRRPPPRAMAACHPGDVTHLACTIRNEHNTPVRGAVPRAQEFTGSDGTSLPATIACTPAALDLEPYERAAVDLELMVAKDATAGRYHGLLLVTGMPDVAEVVTIDVLSPEEPAAP